MASVSILLWMLTIEVLCASAEVLVVDGNNQTIRTFNSESALFGPELPNEGAKGHLVVSKPVEACSTVDKVPNNGTYWIALIKRQPCTFSQKVFNVQEAGYKAAIVHNVGSDELVPMRGDGQTGPIDIPSVFVGETSGVALSLHYLNYTIVLKDSHSSHDNTMFFLPFVVVLPLCTLVMCFFLCVRCLMDQLKNHRLRLSKSNLKKLPIKKFKKGNECETCAICLEEYEDGDKLRELPCAHSYHQKCIDPWLTKNKKTCPLCNKKVFPQDDDSDVENGNEENRSNENTPLLASRTEQATYAGVPSAFANNPHINESDSDESTADSNDELLHRQMISSVEVHAKPICSELPDVGFLEEQPDCSTSECNHRPGAQVSGEQSNVVAMASGTGTDSSGFDEECFGVGHGHETNEQQSSHITSDPLQVEVHRNNDPSQSNETSHCV